MREKKVNDNTLLKLSNLHERNVIHNVKILQFTTFKLSFSDLLRMNHCDYCAQNKPNENSVIPKHREQSKIDIDESKISLNKLDCQHHDVDEKLKESHIRSLLAHIDKTPLKCPITECSQLVGITSVMRHFLRDHRTRIPVDFRECYEGERIGLRFTETMLKHNETVCLGVIAYGGIES